LQSSGNSLTSEHKNSALEILTKLVVLRGESLQNYANLNVWIDEFDRDGYTLQDIENIVNIAKKLPKFNSLSYGDLITAFEAAGGKANGFEDYKRAIESMSVRINELILETVTLGWYKERYLELTEEKAS
jgi:hypothetical protein